MNKKSNKKLIMAGLIGLITLIIIGVTCSGFLDNFKEGIKFLAISLGISAGLVLLLFAMKYIVKGADKLVGKGRTFNERAIVLFSILILVSLTSRGFLENFTMGIIFLIVSIAFVTITFLIMYGINSKKGEIKKAVLSEKTIGEKMFILLTALILVSLTCGGFIQNFKAGILFLIISLVSAVALYLIVTEVKKENSFIGKIVRIETTFNQKMIILLSTTIMVSLTCGGFLKNLKTGLVFLIISTIFAASMLMLVLGVKSKHKIYDRIAGFETTFNEKMMILLGTMAMVSITSGGFLYNFRLGMLFLIVSIVFSSLVLMGVISIRPRVNIFKMRARIQNLGKREAIRAFGMIFACIFVVFNLSGTLAYFTSGEKTAEIVPLKVNYYGSGSSSNENVSSSNAISSLYKAQPGDIVIHFLNEYNEENLPFQVPYIYSWYSDSNGNKVEPTGPYYEDWQGGNQGKKMIREDNNYCWYSYIIKQPKPDANGVGCIIKCPTYGSQATAEGKNSEDIYVKNLYSSVAKTEDIVGLQPNSNSVVHYYITLKGNQNGAYTTNVGTENEIYNNIFGSNSLEKRSMRVFYYTTEQFSNLTVKASDAADDAGEGASQKLIAVKGTEYEGDFPTFESGNWYVSENEVQLGSKKVTSTYLDIYNNNDMIKMFANATSTEVTGGSVYLRNSKVYTEKPIPVPRVIKVHYYDENNIATNMNGTIDNYPSDAVANLENDTRVKWKVGTLTWNNLYLSDEVKSINININNKNYIYESTGADNEIWIKNEEISNTEIKDKNKLMIKYKKVCITEGTPHLIISINGKYYNTNSYTEDGEYYVFEIEYEGNVLSQTNKISEFKIYGANDDIGTKRLDAIEVYNTTHSNNYLWNHSNNKDIYCEGEMSIEVNDELITIISDYRFTGYKY